MSTIILGREPNPSVRFCRRLGQEFPEHLCLDEIRGEMDLVEPQLIGAIAENKSRMDVMVNAKNELPHSAFVDQHCRNMGRIMLVAQEVNPGLEGFERLAEELYFNMVPTPLSIRYDLRRIPELETRIVTALADRCRLVRQATFFKQDLGESSAPARQARNIANARSIASVYASSIPGFEDYIERIYEDLVPSSVALQHRFWRQTQLAAYRHQVRGISAILMKRQDDRIVGLDEFAVKDFVRKQVA